jgi:hypothetical protein
VKVFQIDTGLRSPGITGHLLDFAGFHKYYTLPDTPDYDRRCGTQVMFHDAKD